MDWPSCLCWQLHQQVRTWILKLQHTKISFFSAVQYLGLFLATSSSVSPFSASPSPWDHFPPSALGNCLLMTILRIFPQVSKFTRLPPSMFTFPYTNSELNLLLQMQKQIKKLQKPLLVRIPNPLEKPNVPLRRLWFFFLCSFKAASSNAPCRTDIFLLIPNSRSKAVAWTADGKPGTVKVAPLSPAWHTHALGIHFFFEAPPVFHFSPFQIFCSAKRFKARLSG